MKPLPVQPYVFAEWRQARVHIDYHVEVDRHYYSVPYAAPQSRRGRTCHGAHRGAVLPRLPQLEAKMLLSA